MDYAHKDFTGQSLIERDDMNGQAIIGSCFSQERPDTIVFPPDLIGVTFIDCNLDNCTIPDGNTVQGGSRRRILVQGDGFDWIVDADNNPVERV